MTTILIIDDEKPTLQMLSLFLEASGYRVLTAENEQQGLTVFKRERPQIVLTDIKMPGKDGLDVLRQIKSISPATEVIVITGHGDRDLKEQAMALEASAFFNKPLDTDALDDALQAAQARLAKKDASAPPT
jgi:YesN/AraC family two-component response regulator